MQYKFLIYISYSYALPIGQPIENEILKRNHQVKWFADEKDGKIAIKNKTNVIHKIKEVIDYSPHIILAATNEVPDFLKGIKVQIFHGFNAQKRPEKKNQFSHFRIRGFFDLYCTQGPSTTKGFIKQQQQHKHFEVIETGWSKVDPLFPINKTKAPKIKPSIMIASTFTKRLSLAYNEEVFKAIKVLVKKDIYNFKMVLHPKLPETVKNKWKTLEGLNFKFLDTTDLSPILKSCDVLFADTTSVIQEFIIQQKPVVTFNHTHNHNYLININSAAHISNALKEALNPSEILLNNILKFINELHPYFDGKSSQRIVEKCISFLHKDKSYLKSKPLNLIRKYKIRKRLGYFTLKSYSKAYRC